MYCSQLDKLNTVIREKRQELVNHSVVFHHDIARTHTSLQTWQKLLVLGWNVLPHLPYSPDIASSDYHLFRFIQNSLNGKHYVCEEAVKRHVDQFFAEKDKKFFKREIMKICANVRKMSKDSR